MGRGRGKAKKFSAANHDDTGSGEEEKIPVQKRRGRPQKPLKDDIEEEESDKDSGSTKNGVSSSSKEAKSSVTTENGKRRKRNSQGKDNVVVDAVKTENGVGSRSSTDDSTTKSNGFRHNGSRRKSKPRRAAEAGVACQ